MILAKETNPMSIGHQHHSLNLVGMNVVKDHSVQCHPYR